MSAGKEYGLELLKIDHIATMAYLSFQDFHVYMTDYSMDTPI
jgi:hypothetical protein